MPEPETVYDATLLQLQSVNSVTTQELSLEDFSKPEVVAMLIERQKFTLTELKATQGNLIKTQADLELSKTEISNLKVKLAKSDQRRTNLWLEIPVSFLSGFAINMLTTNFSNGVGWFLLVLSLVMLLFLRFPKVLESLNGNDKESDED